MYTLEDKINVIVRKYYHRLMSLPNVEGVGLGHKFINGYNTKKPCIHVLVSKKISSNCLNSNCMIPKIYLGQKTDVINIGGKFTQYSLKDKIRPLESGYSVSANMNRTGTISCIVFRSKLIGRDYFILSNNHIFADNNKLPIGTKIIQPSYEDRGIVQIDLVGILSEFVPLKFSSLVRHYDNYVDAAIAKVTKIDLISNKIGLIGTLNGIDAAKLDEDVRKVGRTTGLTKGKIQTINATITMHPFSMPDLLFKNQILVNIKQDFGDSGSLLINSDNKVIGLFMGGPSNHVGAFNDFKDVLKYTNTELYL